MESIAKVISIAELSKSSEIAKKNGISQKLTFECPKCKDTGIIYNPKTNSAYICECQERKNAAKKLEFAKVPEELMNATVNGFDITLYSDTEMDQGMSHRQWAMKAKNNAIHYVKNFKEIQKLGKGLYIYHKNPGTGKSHLAVAILNALMKNYGVYGRFVVVKDLIDEIRNTFNKDSEYTKKELVEAVKTVDVLVLDDIGVEDPKPFVKEELYSILNQRMIHKKLTLFTSNCNYDELKLGPRNVSRIKAMTYPVYLPGYDNRIELSRRLEDLELRKLLGDD